MSKKVRGEYAWGVMALGIFAYDMTAIKTKKAETMSSALWRSLQHPIKFPFASLAWGVLTYHLFTSAPARDSLKILYSTYHFAKDKVHELEKH
jgi:hypothetical protein